MKVNIIFSVLFFLLCIDMTYASPIDITHKDSIYRLNDKVKYYLTNEELTIQDVSQQEFVENNFKDHFLHNEDYQYVWLTFELKQTNLKENWILYSSVAQAKVYIPLFYSTWEDISFGYNTPQEKITYSLDKKAVPLKFSDTLQRFFLQVNLKSCNCYSMNREQFSSITIISEQAYTKKMVLEVIEDTIVLAGLLVLILYNFIIFLVFRSKVYLLYVISLSCVWVYIYGNSFFVKNISIYKRLLMTDWLSISNTAVSFCVAFFIFFTLAFFKKEHTNVFKKFLLVLAGIDIVVALINMSSFLFPSYIKLGFTFVLSSNVLFMLIFLSLLVFAISQYRQKSPASGTFLMGNLPTFLFISYFTFLAIYHGGVLLNQFIYLKIGVILQILLFSVALAKRFKTIETRSRQTELEKEQLEKNKALEMQHLTMRKNIELEEKVVIRTQELQEKNEELNQVVEELDITNEKLKDLFNNLNDQHNQIKDSIQYAKTIQQAILPQTSMLTSIFTDFLLFYCPRDIVSGDFYWFAALDEQRYLLGVFDCTGHGVPGAFMSMISYQILNEIVFIQQVNSPDAILQKLKEGITNSLQQQDTQNNDGLDATLLLIDNKKHIISFAGAKNPLYYIDKSNQLVEIKGDNISIGGDSTQQEIFKLHTFHFTEINYLYLSSDGFQDQFGGSNNKKLMKRNFKKLLLDNYQQQTTPKEKYLSNFLQAWQGIETQTDDILVIGFKPQ